MAAINPLGRVALVAFTPRRSNDRALSGGPHAMLEHDEPVAGPSAPTPC